jgi:hypothetical protein
VVALTRDAVLICFLTFVFISEGFAGTIELAASTVHQFVSGKCEIGAPQVERFSNSRPVCTAENPSAKSIRDLKVPMIYVKESEDSYLQALSSQREQDLRIVFSEINLPFKNIGTRCKFFSS